MPGKLREQAENAVFMRAAGLFYCHNPRLKILFNLGLLVTN